MTSHPPIIGGYKSPAVSTGSGLWVDPVTNDLEQESTATSQNGEYVDSKGNRYEDMMTSFVSDDERIIKDKTTEYILDRLGQRKWSSKPIFDTQYHDPNLVRKSPPVTAVFNLGVKEDLDAFNELQRGIVAGGPSVEIVAADRQFYQGAFYIFVTYVKVWYRIPI